MKKEEISAWFQSLQDQICKEINLLEGAEVFHEDQWERAGGGGGRSRAISGEMIEKGGVNFSAVHGEMPAKISSALGLEPNQFFATGVSIVLHPKNPMIPIIHMNVRYFETDKGDWWFGGGIDVTPHYVDEKDAIFFHKYLKERCDQYGDHWYPKFKTWADYYFFIKHRNETRGIGGIFFDRVNTKEFGTKEQCFNFVQDIGNSFVPIYKTFAERHRNEPYTEAQQEWQYLRRSRYVEFNLVWDRGTKFGLDTNGRTESILMSMPPMAKWVYDHQVKPDSHEEKTQKLLVKGIDWINYKEA